MTQEIDLKELEKKACQDSLQGRIIEIVIGFFLIAMIVPMTIPKSVFIYFILMPLLAPITKRLQRRYIYPRIGYSKLHTDPPKETAKGIFTYMIAVLVVVVIISFITSGDMTSLGRLYRWSPAFLGFMIVGAFQYMASKSGNVRYQVFAIVSATLGFVLSIACFDSEFKYIGLIIYLTIMGGFLVISGIMLFILFLHKYPLPEKEVYDVSGN